MVIFNSYVTNYQRVSDGYIRYVAVIDGDT
jgi:hypothetical protein